ncbi:LacI family DNA-binding transcriptional regulator [Microbacterium sp. LWH13-1.2]|uniref:LacI family DNA-binding transcriptional regulator n=1 Tax=Microbacterium sp. LWH13-1.2 TaxID=3135260 RepID=UPI003139445F
MPDIGLRDVAERAGVSIGTVSNALNRPELVSESAAARVAEAVDELGYVPNIAARQLKAGRSDAIGFSVINITNPFFADLAFGAEEQALTAGYSVLVGNGFDSAERESRYLDLFERQRVDGVLIAPVEYHEEYLQRFRRRGVPVVLVDQRHPRGEFSSVSVDNRLGGRIAAQALLDGGCRHLAFIGGPKSREQMNERLTGLHEVADAAGVRTTLIETTTLNTGLGREIGEQIADLPAADRPDGIFAGNDHLALGLLQGLVGRGLRVPEDISLVGYDDIEFAGAAVVPLTSVRQPAREMGARAIELLMHHLAGSDDPIEARFVPELVVRASTRSH